MVRYRWKDLGNLSTFHISLAIVYAASALILNSVVAGNLLPNLQGLPLLAKVDLGYNNLNGSIDTINWGSLPQLTYVVLNDNAFTSIGNAFNNTPKMQQLEMASNPNLNGTFPPYLLNMTTFNQM